MAPKDFWSHLALVTSFFAFAPGPLPFSSGRPLNWGASRWQ